MKKILVSLFIVFALVTTLNFVPVKAFGGGFNESNIKNQASDKTQKLKSSTQKIVGTALIIFQISAVAGLLAMGVKYMYSSPEQKASLKKSTISIVVGLILVFACSTVAQFIVSAFNEVTS